MDEAKVENFLAHYASKYYDPAKAREYYLKNRELKGREAGPQLSKESRQRQSEATAYVSNQINTKKTADLKANASQRDALNAAAEAQAKAHAARMEKLSEDATALREAVVSKIKAKLAKLDEGLKIPDNASPKLRAFLEKQQAKQRASLSKDAAKELGALKDSIMTAVSGARAEYDSFRKGNTQARRDNSTNRRKITDTARKDLETEKKNIKEQVR